MGPALVWDSRACGARRATGTSRPAASSRPGSARLRQPSASRPTTCRMWCTQWCRRCQSTLCIRILRMDQLSESLLSIRGCCMDWNRLRLWSTCKSHPRHSLRLETVVKICFEATTPTQKGDSHPGLEGKHKFPSPRLKLQHHFSETFTGLFKNS